MSNVTLYGNWAGSWIANQTNSTPVSNTPVTFTKKISDGTYLWNCLACDNSSQCRFASSNNTFTIDSTPPELFLVDPNNDHAFSSGTTSITFSWNVIDNLDSNISCNVYTQDAYQSTIYCSSETTCEQEISGFSAGSHAWSVNCSDGINQSVRSETRNFSIVSGRNSGGGGGGGGGAPTQNVTNQTKGTNNTGISGYNSSSDNLNESGSEEAGSKGTNSPGNGNISFIKKWFWLIALIVVIGIVIAYFVVSANVRKRRGILKRIRYSLE
ncbi:MAG: hypothetical protein NTX24_05225 [Candidatus Pacearchaeota archaeon]|nr:hypothetical protein [Candidatus Pacearchaeota archaeon]